MDLDAPELGPIDYALFEFPGNRFNGEIAPNIVDLVARGLITLLDLVFVKKADDGELTILEISDMDADEIGEFSFFRGSLNEVLSADDIQAAGEILEANTSALFVVWENTWAAPLASAIYEAGGVLATSGRIPALDLLAAVQAGD